MRLLGSEFGYYIPVMPMQGTLNKSHVMHNKLYLIVF